MRLLLCGHHVDVVCCQELPDASDGGAPRRHEGGRAKVRGPLGLGQLLGEALVLAGTDLGQRENLVTLMCVHLPTRIGGIF